MKKIIFILSISLLIFGLGCEGLVNSSPEPEITVLKNKPHSKLILFTEMDIENNGTRIYGIDPTDSTLKKHIHISNLRSDGADVTQTALNLGAAIDNAKANGSTLIEGGYINTNILKVGTAENLFNRLTE